MNVADGGGRMLEDKIFETTTREHQMLFSAMVVCI